MKIIKILIVEDPSIVEVALRSRLISMGFDIVSVLADPKKAISFLKKEKADLVLMDTFMDLKYTGIEAANEIYKQYDTSVILMCSKEKPLGMKLKESEAKVIMCKPLSDIELEFNIRAILKAKKTATEVHNYDTNPYIFVKADYRLNKIRLSDIYYLEANKDYVAIHTTDNVYSVHATMKEMEQALPSSLFARTHRSFIVNIDKIFSIKYPEILIEKKMKIIQIGGLYRKRLFEKINVI